MMCNEYNQTDSTGKNYKVVLGSIKEYEPEVFVNGCWVPQSKATQIKQPLKTPVEETQRQQKLEKKDLPYIYYL